MAIPVKCACGQAFSAKDELAGRRVKCPKCGQPLAIPNPGGHAPPAGAARQVPNQGMATPRANPAVGAASGFPAGFGGQPADPFGTPQPGFQPPGMMGQAAPFGTAAGFGLPPDANMMQGAGMQGFGAPGMGMGTPGMGMPGAGMYGGGMGSLPQPPRRKKSNKKAILWISLGVGGTVLLLLAGGCVMMLGAAVRQARVAANRA
ncbi:MAG: hypothetical protein AB7O62_26630, partial [Pirellulales bacterium]